MTRHIALIGAPPDVTWATVARAALDPAGTLDLIAEADVVRHGLAAGYDLALVDAVTVSEPEVLVGQLHRQQATLPIVVVTASPTWRRARVAFLAGAKDYLHKTLDIEELRTELSDVLAELKRPPDTASG